MLVFCDGGGLKTFVWDYLLLCVHVGAALRMCMSGQLEGVCSFLPPSGFLRYGLVRLNSKHLDLLSHPASPFLLLFFGSFVCLFLRWSSPCGSALHSQSPRFRLLRAGMTSVQTHVCTAGGSHTPSLATKSLSSREGQLASFLPAELVKVAAIMAFVLLLPARWLSHYRAVGSLMLRCCVL